MKVILCDLQKEVVDAWRKEFKGYSDVESYCESILNYQADAIISPANSYGEMSGGIDGVYTRHFGPQLQQRLQAHIKNLPMGELLVGETALVKTDCEAIPWMISAPTMRVPADVSRTVNAYLAFKAVLICAQHHKFTSILCPGLGTATGGMLGSVCANQMRQAYDEIILQKRSFPKTIGEAYYNDRITKNGQF